MITLQEEFDRIDATLSDLEERGKGDVERCQEYADKVECQRILFDVTKSARERGLRVHDITALHSKSIIKIVPGWYDMTKIAWQCPKGHIFKDSLSSIESALSLPDDPCRICARVSAQGNSDVAVRARLKLSMQHDERGEVIEMENYVNINEHHTYESRATGGVFAIRGKNVHHWTRPWDDAVQDVWIAEDGEYAFLWTGTRPIVKNPALLSLFKAEDCVIDTFYGDKRGCRGYTHKSGLERAIRECIDDGAKVLNVSLNPQFVNPGVYTWGDLAEQNAEMYAWLEQLRQRWLDAKG